MAKLYTVRSYEVSQLISLQKATGCYMQLYVQVVHANQSPYSQESSDQKSTLKYAGYDDKWSATHPRGASSANHQIGDKLLCLQREMIGKMLLPRGVIHESQSESPKLSAQNFQHCFAKSHPFGTRSRLTAGVDQAARSVHLQQQANNIARVSEIYNLYSTIVCAIV